MMIYHNVYAIRFNSIFGKVNTTNRIQPYNMYIHYTPAVACRYPSSLTSRVLFSGPKNRTVTTWVPVKTVMYNTIYVPHVSEKKKKK